MRSPFRLDAHRPDALLGTQLDVRVDASLGHITLVGELDRQTGHRLLDAARTLAASGHTYWVIDAHDLHFCDASGLRAISVTYRIALRYGATMRVVGAGRWLRRALATIRLHHHVFADDGRAGRDGTVVAYAPVTFPLAKVYTL